MTRPLQVRLAALLALVSVGFGAFAAHGVDARAAQLMHTGSLYGFIHALAALTCAVAPFASRRRVDWAAGLFLAGAVLFCGSLYALAFGAPRIVGAATPLGGLAFMAGWAMLAWAASQLRQD